MTSTRDIALKYGERRVAIFPCGQDKQPLVNHWPASASADPSTISAWFQEHPDALIGLPVKPLGLVVIDADRHKDGHDGVEYLRQLCLKHGELPPHPWCTTANNGEHHYFKQPAGEKIGNKKIGNGLETRGGKADNDGGYVIAPGSILSDGRRWWRASASPSLLDSLRDDAIPEMPAWLLDLIRPPESPADTSRQEQPPNSRNGAGDHRHRAYAEAALGNLCKELACMPPESGRNVALNNAALTMGHQVASGWIERGTVEANLFDACIANGLVKDTGSHKVRGTIKSGIDAGEKEPHRGLQDRALPLGGNPKHQDSSEPTKGSEPRFKLVPFEQLTIGSELVYLVKGIIPRVGLVVVWGPPKCGKSFWTFDLTLHVALDWLYRGRKVLGGPVVYCAFEGQEGYGRRAEAFRRNLAEQAAPIPFYLIATRMGLAKDHAELITAIKRDLGEDVKPVVIVLDTLNRSLEGSESDDKDMAAYIRAGDAVREEFGCAVIIVHHCGIDGSRPRGHTSLTGAVDAQLAVKRDGSGNVVVTVEWMKDGPEGEVIVSRLEQVEVGQDPDGDPITSCVVVPVDGPAPTPDKPKGLPKAAKTALRALREATDEVGEVPPASNHIPAAMRVVTFDQWRDYAYRLGISTGEERARRLAFQRATEQLIGDGRVGVWDEQAWLP
jgi:hypothetical protein